MMCVVYNTHIPSNKCRHSTLSATQATTAWSAPMRGVYAWTTAWSALMRDIYVRNKAWSA